MNFINQRSDRVLQIINQFQLVKNGNFSINTCILIWCLYTPTTFAVSYISNWLPDPQIQIGYAYFYITGSGSERVAQLAANKGTCIKQLIQNVPKGIYTLKYSYGCKVDLPLAMGQVYVYFNNTMIDSRQAIDNKWHYVTKNITISQDNLTFYLRFCGNESAGWYGVAVGNISLKFTTNVQINTNTTSAISTKNITNTSSNATSNTSSITTNATVNSTLNSMTNKTGQNTISNASAIGAEENNEDSTQDTVNNSGNSKKHFELNNDSAQSSLFKGDFNMLNQNYALYYNFYSEQSEDLNDFGVMKIFNSYLKNIFLGATLNSPAIRKTFKIWFSCFINIDHLWLYIYHNTEKTLKSDIVLFKINEFQNSKWNIIPQDIEKEYLFVSTIQTIFNIKLNQTPKKFRSIQQSSRLFFEFSYKFFIVSIPLMVLVLIIGKFLNQIMKKCKYLGFFESFQQKNFLIILLFEGNSQAFTYFLISDILSIFAENKFMKFLNILSLTLFFMMIILLIAVPFLFRYFYRNKIFYDKCKNCLRGSVFFMVDFGLFNMILGSIHILAQNYYKTQLLLLFCCQSLFVIYTISNFKAQKDVLNDKQSIWLVTFGSLLRMILVSTYYFYIIAPGSIQEQLYLVQYQLIILSIMNILFGLTCMAIFVVYQIFIYTYKKIQDFLKRRNQSSKCISLESTKKIQKITGDTTALKVDKLKRTMQRSNNLSITSVDPQKLTQKIHFQQKRVAFPRLKTCLSVKKMTLRQNGSAFQNNSAFFQKQTIKIDNKTFKQVWKIKSIKNPRQQDQQVEIKKLKSGRSIVRENKQCQSMKKILKNSLKLKSQKYLNANSFL